MPASTDKSARLLSYANLIRERGRHAREEKKKDKKIVRLEKALSEAKDGRLEERFMWIVSLMILFDAYFFAQISLFESFLIFVFQLFLLIPLAKKLEIKEVMTVLDRVSRFFQKGAST